MLLVLLELLRGNSCGGVNEQEGNTEGKLVGGNLYDLDAVNFADDTLGNHVLRLVAFLHEGRIHHEEVAESVGTISEAALCGNVLVAHALLTLEELGIGGVGSRSTKLKCAVLESGLDLNTENVAVILYLSSMRFVTPHPPFLAAAYHYADETISSPALRGVAHFHSLECTSHNGIVVEAYNLNVNPMKSVGY